MFKVRLSKEGCGWLLITCITTAFMFIGLWMYHSWTSYHPGWAETTGVVHRFEWTRVVQRKHAGIQVDVEYMYAVSGVEHRGTKFSDDNHEMGAGRLEWFAQHRLNDSTVPVYFNPSMPSESALWNEPLVHPVVHYLPYVGVVGLVLLAWWQWLRKWML